MKLKDVTLLEWLVIVLILFQIILIGFVIWNVHQVSEVTRDAINKSAAVEQPMPQQVADSVQVAVATGWEPSGSVAPRNSNAVADSSPTIISIILTLITLCVTLSIVIPYVEGKTMTESKIRTVAKEYYKDAFESIERYYADTLEDSLWEDAHSARMTAYLLHKSADESDRVWSIGFASKAILRYVKLIHQKPDRYGHNAYHEIDFINDCVGYMNSVERSFEKADSKKMLRAFSDLSFAAFLAKRFDFGAELQGLMKEMYPRLKDLVTSDDIDAVMKKHRRHSDEEEMERFGKWMSKWVKDNGEKK
jgi:hypothetical protein